MEILQLYMGVCLHHSEYLKIIKRLLLIDHVFHWVIIKQRRIPNYGLPAKRFNIKLCWRGLWFSLMVVKFSRLTAMKVLINYLWLKLNSRFSFLTYVGVTRKFQFREIFNVITHFMLRIPIICLNYKTTRQMRLLL